MKQKQPPTWATKIDKEGLQFLTGVRYARRAVKLGKDDPNEVRKFVTEVLPQICPGFAQGRKIVITNEMLERLKEAGMSMSEKLKPGEHKLPENTARLFENIQMMQGISNDPQFPKAFPLVAAFGLMIAQEVYSGIALHQFGTTDLNGDQMIWTTGATLESFGRMLKERKPLDLGKGRVNVELLGLIRTIREHQTKKLRPKELRQALEYAGYHVSNEESLRLFEWRAKEKGQL